MNGWLNQPTHQINGALKLLPHFGRPNKCALYLWAPSMVSSDTCVATRVLSDSHGHPCLPVSVICWWHLPSTWGLWHSAQYLPAHPCSRVHPGNFHAHTDHPNLGILDSILLHYSSRSPQEHAPPPSIWPSPRISSPQESWTQKFHLLTRTFILTSVPLPHSHGFCFLTSFRPSILGPFLI